MRCPECNSRHIGVVRTLPLKDIKLRTRICYNCKHVFDTKEIIIKGESQENLFTMENKNGNERTSKKNPG